MPFSCPKTAFVYLISEIPILTYFIPLLFNSFKQSIRLRVALQRRKSFFNIYFSGQKCPLRFLLSFYLLLAATVLELLTATARARVIGRFGQPFGCVLPCNAESHFIIYILLAPLVGRNAPCDFF